MKFRFSLESRFKNKGELKIVRRKGKIYVVRRKTVKR